MYRVVSRWESQPSSASSAVLERRWAVVVVVVVGVLAVVVPASTANECSAIRRSTRTRVSARDCRLRAVLRTGTGPMSGRHQISLAHRRYSGAVVGGRQRMCGRSLARRTRGVDGEMLGANVACSGVLGARGWVPMMCRMCCGCLCAVNVPNATGNVYHIM